MRILESGNSGTAARMAREIRKSTNPEVQHAVEAIVEAIMWERVTLGDDAALLDAAITTPEDANDPARNTAEDAIDREIRMNVTKALFRIRTAEFGICEGLSEDHEKELIKILQDAGLHPVFRKSQ